MRIPPRMVQKIDISAIGGENIRVIISDWEIIEKKITIQFPVSFCNALHTHLLKYNTINAYLMLFLRQKNIHSFLEMYCEINFFCGIFFNNCLKHLHKISIQWEWDGRHKKICVLIDGNIFFSSHLSYFVSGI